jgi:hypothetical protein
MEGEARLILQAACAGEAKKPGGEALQRWVAKMYGHKRPVGVVDALLAERRREAAGE